MSSAKEKGMKKAVFAGAKSFRAQRHERQEDARRDKEVVEENFHRRERSLRGGTTGKVQAAIESVPIPGPSFENLASACHFLWKLIRNICRPYTLANRN